jgi:hypothetical protein
MRLDLENLPSDIDLLHRLVRDMATVVESRDNEIDRLQRLIKQFQRRRFGRRSERLDPDLCLPFIPSAPATEANCNKRPYVYGRLLPSTIGRESKDFCCGQS